MAEVVKKQFKSKYHILIWYMLEKNTSPSVAVLLPCYNEEVTIGKVIRYQRIRRNGFRKFMIQRTLSIRRQKNSTKVTWNVYGLQQMYCVSWKKRKQMD